MNDKNRHKNNDRITQKGRNYYLDGRLINSKSVSEAVSEYYPKFVQAEVLEKLGPTSKSRLSEDGKLLDNDGVVRKWGASRDFGVRCHDLIEALENGNPISTADTENLKHYFDWMINGKPKWWQYYWLEQPIWCPHTHDANYTPGRLDALFKHENKDEFYHVDWKFILEPETKLQKSDARIYCTCGVWRFGDPEQMPHQKGCSAIGPTPQTEHLLMYKWAKYAGNNSLYCEMLRRNYGLNVVESRIVYLHPLSPKWCEKPVDFVAHQPLVNAILGNPE